MYRCVCTRTHARTHARTYTHTHTHSTIILAPIIGGVAGTTIFPLLLATILAYCVTGYVRDELYHPVIKACVGQMCNVCVSDRIYTPVV